MSPSTGNSLPSDRAQRNARTPFQSTADRLGAGRFGLTLFLISLGALFAATLVAFLVLRFQAGERWPATLPCRAMDIMAFNGGTHRWKWDDPFCSRDVSA